MSNPGDFPRALPAGMRVGDSISGSITVLTSFGAFADIGRPPCVGLVHFLNLPEVFRKRDARGNVLGPPVGARIEAVVLGTHDSSQVHLSMTEPRGSAHARWNRITETVRIDDRFIVDRRGWLPEGIGLAFQHPEFGYMAGRINCSPDRKPTADNRKPFDVRVVGFDPILLEILAEQVLPGE